MSSNEEDVECDGPSGALHGSKKRRIQRACDICRRKKIRCDGVQMPRNRCSNCAAYGQHCTYLETAKKRGPSKGYVEGLEHKLEKMEKLLRRLCPDESVYQSILNAMEKDNGTSEQEPLDADSLMGQSSVPPPSDDKSPTILDALSRAIRNSPLGQTAVGDDEDDFGVLVADLKSLAIEPSDVDRFFGKSSGAMLIQRAIEAKRDFADPNKSHPALSVRNARPEFWVIPEWEKYTRTLVSARNFIPPPTDLAEGLIDLYFNHTNKYLPLLHRPTFEKGVKANLHVTNTGFGSVYMLVCSLGSKFSNDPRVKYDGQESPHSAGWKWFNQAITSMKTPLSPATLYDLQSYALAVQFLSSSASPQNCWTLIGIGLRVAQDVGAHRKRPRGWSPAEDESWKRGFWVLYVLDRLFSASLGRPCAIHEEDFDLDLPTDCNDEYWDDDDDEDPTKCFKQPEDVPSRITAFLLLIKLTRILSVTLRTIYASNKCKLSWGYKGGEWEEKVVAELDSALNSWVDLVPAHLRWDPNREDKYLFDQSVVLYSNYYFLQIIVHRPFIPTPNKPTPSSFPSLAICANAARSCSHLADLQRKRTMLAPITQMAVCTAAVILLLNLWSGKKSGLSAEVVKKDMKDVYMCMQALKSVEKRWQAAGRLWDLLSELAYVGDLPLPEAKPVSSNKRPRGSNGPQSSHQGQEALPNESRNIAGSRRVHKESTLLQPLSQQENSPGFYQHTSPGSNSSTSESVDSPAIGSSSLQSPQSENFHLPMYSKELAQLPLHGPFSFGLPQHPEATAQTTSSTTTTTTTGSGGWHPMTYPGNTGIDPLSTPTAYSSSSLHHHQPFAPQTGFLREMISPSAGNGSSDPVMNLGMMNTMGPNYPVTLQRFLQESSPFNVTPMLNQDSPFNVPSNSSIPSPLPQPVQGHNHPHHHHQQQQQHHHHQQLENLRHMNAASTTTPTGVPGIVDLGTVNSDLMSMWLNSSPGLFPDDWATYFSTFGHAPLNQG